MFLYKMSVMLFGLTRETSVAQNYACLEELCF